MAILVALVFMILSISKFLPIQANNNSIGFSVALIHRDSPDSPLYNPNLSHYERLEISFQRSVKKSNQIQTTNLIPDGGQYLMNIAHGTPAIDSLSLIDTGSDLSWIQCLPCIHCYPSASPPFNPNNSRTFEQVSCPLSKCLKPNNAKNNYCKPINAPCTYIQSYLDGSHSKGNLVRDTITLGSGSGKISFPKFLFGCGHDNTGIFPHKSAGIVGFGPKNNSFISQLAPLHGGKFSFCMAPPTSSPGRVSFGTQATVSGPGVVSTPLILGHEYEVMLQGVTVGTKRLKYFPNRVHFRSNDSKQVNTGKILIDSGTTLTFIPSTLHLQFQAMLRRQIKVKPVRAKEPFTLCYSSSLRNGDVPKITFEFPGANLELPMLNTFVKNSPSTRCLAILPSEDDIILGNLALNNVLVGFDLVNKKVSFKQTDCTRH